MIYGCYSVKVKSFNLATFGSFLSGSNEKFEELYKMHKTAGKCHLRRQFVSSNFKLNAFDSLPVLVRSLEQLH